MEHRAGPSASDLTRRHIGSAHARATTEATSTRDQIDQLTLLVLAARDRGIPLDDTFRDDARHQLGLARDSFDRLSRDALDDVKRQISEERRIQRELAGEFDNTMSFWHFLSSCWGGR